MLNAVDATVPVSERLTSPDYNPSNILSETGIELSINRPEGLGFRELVERSCLERCDLNGLRSPCSLQLQLFIGWIKAEPQMGTNQRAGTLGTTRMKTLTAEPG